MKDADVLLAFALPGRARSKGSVIPRCVENPQHKAVVRDSPLSKAWRKYMAVAAFEAKRDREKCLGPIEVRAVFTFERPLNTESGTDPYPVVNSGKNAAGDEDKLDRNLLDALQDAGVYQDDSQVVRLRTTKIWAGFGIEPGVRVVVRKAPRLTGECLICGALAMARECPSCFLAGELTVSASLGEGAGPVQRPPGVLDELAGYRWQGPAS